MSTTTRLGAWPLLFAAACVSAAPQQGGEVQRPTGAPPVDPTRAWPIRSFEHVDLWFHGFAMVTQDTAKVPYFVRGYRDQMVALRQQRNAYTSLDANRETLSARFTANPALNNAQFAIFHYQSLDELGRAVDAFIRAEGSPGAVPDPALRQQAAYLTPYFRSVADRDWLRLFMQALRDEHTRFYGPYWNTERNNRNAALSAIESHWTGTHRARLQRFLNNTRQGDGTFVLSMPLDGEGRSVFSQEGNAVAIGFPPTAERAMEAIYAFTHEIVGTVAGQALNDNLTPAQVREGEAARHSPIAAVRGGALLLQRVSPDDVAGYMRYYLRVTGATPPTGDPSAAFVSTFPLPEAVVDGIRRQIDAVLAGF